MKAVEVRLRSAEPGFGGTRTASTKVPAEIVNSSTMGAGRGVVCAGCFDQTGRVREVYLHVDLLWRHRDDLARPGYHHPGTHANEMWLATNALQDGAFVNYEMPQASGVWAQVCKRALAYDGPSVISHEYWACRPKNTLTASSGRSCPLGCR